jgi:hypothetical protein
MLDDHACRPLVEGLYTLQRSIGVGDIVVGQFLALQLPCRGNRGLARRMLDKECGALVRVLAIAHGLYLTVLQVQRVRKIGPVTIGADGTEVVGNRTVIAGRVLKDFHGQRITSGIRHRVVPGTHLIQHRCIVLAVHQHRYRRMVLGGCTQQGRAAYIDILDRRRQVAAGARHRLFKGIQIHCHEVDGHDAVVLHHGVIDTPASEYAAVDLRMQGLDPAIHHFRKPGKVRNLDYRHALVSQ